MASPVESDYPLAHPVVVGALLLNVLPFNAAAAPERTVALAAALGLASDGSPNAVADRIVSALRRLYSDLGQPLTMPDQGADAATYEALAVRAVTAIARGRKVDEPITRDTVILSPNLRDAKVSDAVSIYEKSFA